jgi:hypothetical protein
MKQFEENHPTLKGQMVRVDSVILPAWAENRHHFIFMNYLALEHPKVRTKINYWIDLVFGEKTAEARVLQPFQPLTSEVPFFEPKHMNRNT